MELKNRKLLFLCNDCENGFKQIPLLIKKVNDLENQIQDIQTNKQNLISAGVQDNLNITANMETPIISTILHEVEQRTIRAKNLMIYNVKESALKNIKDRIEEDKNLITESLGKTGLNTTDILKIIRVGKKTDNKIRPIKVILRDSSLASQALKNKNKLLPTDPKIGPDQTIMQRDQLKKVKEELTKRQQKGEKNLIIKFISGTPKIIQKNVD